MADGEKAGVQPDASTEVAKVKLWLIGAAAVFSLAAGTLAGATVLSPGAEAGAGQRDNGDAAAPAPAPGGQAPMVGGVYDCPAGNEVGRLSAGDRVYIVGRDDSGTWLAIRNPDQVSEVVWVEASVLVPDREVDVEPMPCAAPLALTTPDLPATTTAPESPSTTVVPGPRPDSATTAPPSSSTTPATTTTAAPDKQAPTMQVSSSRDAIDRLSGEYCVATSTAILTVTAADNVGVTSVTATYSGLPGSPLHFERTSGSPTNGTWTATFGPFTSSGQRDVEITATARDAQGNSSAAAVTIDYSGYCLI